MQAWRQPSGHAGSSAYDAIALTYVRQGRDKKLIYYDNTIATEDQLQGSGQRSADDGFAVNVAVVGRRDWRVVWWFWWVDGRTATSALKTKLMQVRAMLFGDPSAALMLVTATCTSPRCEREFNGEPPWSLLRQLRDLQPLNAIPTDAH